MTSNVVGHLRFTQWNQGFVIPGHRHSIHDLWVYQANGEIGFVLPHHITSVVTHVVAA